MEQMKLLDKTRLGILISNRQDGTPVGVPIWFDWDGEVIRFFSTKTSQKIKRLTRHSHASLLVTNNVGEPEAWVAFDGEVSVHQSGGIELAEKLAAAYWDLTDQKYAERLASWQAAADIFALLELVPTNIRAGS
jgi:nitroimidazol reductase NimA-like FMN-containing flavoprotein (pyridoxamine 5'-phosphate oxidase superfamily)